MLIPNKWRRYTFYNWNQASSNVRHSYGKYTYPRRERESERERESRLVWPTAILNIHKFYDFHYLSTLKHPFLHSCDCIFSCVFLGFLCCCCLTLSVSCSQPYVYNLLHSLFFPLDSNRFLFHHCNCTSNSMGTWKSRRKLKSLHLLARDFIHELFQNRKSSTFLPSIKYLVHFLIANELVIRCNRLV